jgi:hypothetical protein
MLHKLKREKMETMKKKSIFGLVLSVSLSILLLCGCSSDTTDTGDATENDGADATPGIEKLDTPTDYSNTDNWLSLPETTDKEVDVIYLYPSVWQSTDDSDVIANIDDETMREPAQDKLALQGLLFSDDCNVFAPYYRQADAGYALTLPGDERDNLIRSIADADPMSALDYYFENYNDGRPFILASHSQGSQVMSFILSEYMSVHLEYYERMIAAYVIGYSVTQAYLDENYHLKFAQGADDTGVIVSYNTEGPGNSGQSNVVVVDGSIAINPLNWQRDDTYAGVAENEGSMFDAGTLVEGIADAQVDTERGVVVCASVDPDTYAVTGTDLFGPESYHGCDYAFYYENLKENVATRIASYFGE